MNFRIDNENGILIFGTMCTTDKIDRVEIFRRITTADDLPNMKPLELRARYNTHRAYRYFYFRASLHTYDILSNKLKENNEYVAELLKKSKTITFERL